MAQIVKNIQDLGNRVAGVLNVDQAGKNLNDLGRNTDRLSTDLQKFGADISGKTAREKADLAATAQEQAQLDAEAAARHQKRLAENSADFKRQRNAQLVQQMVSGGRTGTLMNGTTGFTSGSGETTGGPTAGSKTLMGR